MDVSIQHDTEQHKFYGFMEGKEYFLTYRKKDEQILDYQHTFVPLELRGRKLGEKLVKFALNYAKENHYKVIPTCPFVQRFVAAHPEYQSLLAT